MNFLKIFLTFLFYLKIFISINIAKNKNAIIENDCANRRIVGFFNHMRKKRPFTKFQASKLTHLIFHTTFVDDLTFDIKYMEKSVEQFADYEETVRIARTNPNLKIMTMIGGPDIYSTFFPTTLDNSIKKSIFIRNVQKFINESKLDGVNIWWAPNVVSQEDKGNFALFIKELRTEFDRISRHLQISVLTTKWGDLIRSNYLLNAITNYTDFIHTLSYGYYSPKSAEKKTGPLAPIYKSRPFERNEYLHQTMKELACGAENPRKINLGIGLYAWKFEHVSASKLWEMDEMWRMSEENTLFGTNYYNYRDLKNVYNLSDFKFHDLAKTVYHYDPQNGSFVGAENFLSIKLKLNYATDFGLGGIMISNIDHDDDNDTLLNYIYEEWIEKCQINNKKRLNYSCEVDSIDQLTNPVIFPLKREWLSNQVKCCQTIMDNTDNNQDIGLNCSALGRGLSPAIQNNGHKNRQYYQFFTECILANETHKKCCQRKNVSNECLSLCIGTTLLSFNEMNALIELNCSVLTQEIAAECALEIYELKKFKIMLTHYITIGIVIFMASFFVIINKCRQCINKRKKAKLTEKLQIGNELGIGSFAQVHEAKWHGKQVAIKRLFVEGNAEMNREFQILKRLEHPNLCRTFEVVMIERKLGILMEFAEFGNLQKFLYHHKPYDYGDKESRKLIIETSHLIEISLMIANGLKYLFSKNIIHRDLATRNCLVFRSTIDNPSAIAFGHLFGIIVKISDFGLSRILENDRNAYYASHSYAWILNCFGLGPKVTSVMDESNGIKSAENGECSKNFIGGNMENQNNTENQQGDESIALLCSGMQRKKIFPLLPILVAPECLENRKYTVQSDIWSFGMLLIELFDYGKTPFENEHPKMKQAKICSGILPEIPKNTPEEIVNLIEECCKMEPKMRIGIAEICNQLEMMKLEGNNNKRIMETTL